MVSYTKILRPKNLLLGTLAGVVLSACAGGAAPATPTTNNYTNNVATYSPEDCKRAIEYRTVMPGDVFYARGLLEGEIRDVMEIEYKRGDNSVDFSPRPVDGGLLRSVGHTKSGKPYLRYITDDGIFALFFGSINDPDGSINIASAPEQCRGLIDFGRLD